MVLKVYSKLERVENKIENSNVERFIKVTFTEFIKSKTSQEKHHESHKEKNLEEWFESSGFHPKQKTNESEEVEVKKKDHKKGLWTTI